MSWQIISHRGASDSGENTIEAAKRAAAQGADRVEIDVRKTADGYLAVVHDATLDRTTDAADRFPELIPWRTAEMSWSQIRQLDAGDGEQIPTLKAMLRLGLPLMVEIKDRRVSPARVARTVGGHDVTVISKHEGWLTRFVQVSETPAMLVIRRTPSESELDAWARWAAGLSARGDVLDVNLIDQAHRRGLTVVGWTINDRHRAGELRDAGADGIITDHVPQMPR